VNLTINDENRHHVLELLIEKINKHANEATREFMRQTLGKYSDRYIFSRCRFYGLTQEEFDEFLDKKINPEKYVVAEEEILEEEIPEEISEESLETVSEDFSDLIEAIEGLEDERISEIIS